MIKLAHDILLDGPTQVGVISRRLGLSTRIVLAVEEQPFERLSFTKIDAAGFSEFEATCGSRDEKLSVDSRDESKIGQKNFGGQPG